MALLALTLAAPRQAADPALRERVMTIVANSGAEVAVAFRTLDGRTELLIDPDKVFHAASTMKVPVMIELFRQAQAGSSRSTIRCRFATSSTASSMAASTSSMSATIRMPTSTKPSGRRLSLRAAVRGHDHGEQQLRREPADRAAGRREHPADGHAAWSGRNAGAARRGGRQGV